MKSSVRLHLGLVSLAILLSGITLAAAESQPAKKKIVLIAGKKSHGPEGNRIHDYPWTVKLLKVLLSRSNISDQVRAEVHFNGWPQDEHTLDDADTIMIVSDGRDGDKFEEAPHFLNPARTAVIERQMKRGCGFVTFHFSTFASEANRRQILEWSGGYFQWEAQGLRKWYSAIKVLDAELALPTPGHAIMNGVTPFRLKEEFYYNLRFDPSDKALVPLLAVPTLPGRDPDGHWVAWARERADGGRGFGTSCGHFYDNWKNDGFRKMMLNAIAWSAHVKVPANGVESSYLEHDEITAALGTDNSSIFDLKNISALWIAPPWDAKKRGPEERMEMLKELGLSKFAHNGGSAVDAEIEAAKKHGIEIAAWWYPARNPPIVESTKRHGIHPQFWVCGSRAITVTNNAERIEAEAARIRPIAEDVAAIACKVGLYNHREPWFEEQDHQIAIIERLKRDGITNVGIVFNFHHWRGSLAEFPALFKRMQPYLIAVNFNGMSADTTKYPPVRYLGSDESELAMIRVVEASGWRGPIGVIHERPTVDASEGIRGNLQGLEWVQKELQQPGSGGPKPQEPTPPAKVQPKPASATNR
jgi:type 1 glutamine amidotransferase